MVILGARGECRECLDRKLTNACPFIGPDFAINPVVKMDLKQTKINQKLTKTDKIDKIDEIDEMN